jgi:hypothetical protein
MMLVFVVVIFGVVVVFWRVLAMSSSMPSVSTMAMTEHMHGHKK